MVSVFPNQRAAMFGQHSTVIPNDQNDDGAFTKSSRQWMQNKLALLQRHLELDQELTRYQPPQVQVVSEDDDNTRVVLLTTADLFWKYQAIESGSFGDNTTPQLSAPLSSAVLRGTDFRVSERYRCVADKRGQVQGGVGFIFEGTDLAENTKVAVKFFHRTDDDAASSRINVELITCIRLNHGLHSVYIDEDDARDLRHLSRLRDILVDAPILGDCGEGDFAPSTFRATALVFDWADGGDAHSWVRTQGGVTPAEGARLFRQVMRGLRALHRRGIVHRDIKPENVLLAHESQTASLCDFGFAKHVPSSQPSDLLGDPTTCYQPPERWLACHSQSAVDARSRAAGGNGVRRRDETPTSVFASDIFSAGVSLFLLVAYQAVLTRLVTDTSCGDVPEADDSSLPALHVFQHAPGGEMFGLLQAEPRVGGVQGRLWAYWEVYGLQLPPGLRGLLDGVLHPVPDKRFTMEQAFVWMDTHPEMFSGEDEEEEE